MPRRRTALAEDVRRALARLDAGELPAGAPALPPDALDRLRALTEVVEGMLEEISTGKSLWRLEPTSRALTELTRRAEAPEDADAARSALEDLLGVLTDQSRWR